MNIEPELCKAVAAEAKRQRVTETNLIKMLLADGLARIRGNAAQTGKLDAPVYGEGGLLHEMDLNDRSQILDLLNPGS